MTLKGKTTCFTLTGGLLWCRSFVSGVSKIRKEGSEGGRVGWPVEGCVVKKNRVENKKDMLYE